LQNGKLIVHGFFSGRKVDRDFVRVACAVQITCSFVGGPPTHSVEPWRREARLALIVRIRRVES
jgi:hypothetical protein